MLACEASGEQGHMFLFVGASGEHMLSPVARVAGAVELHSAGPVGRAYKHVEFGFGEAITGAYGLAIEITHSNIDLNVVSCKADFYEYLWDSYSLMFPSKFTSACLLPAEHAELGQMLGTGSDSMFPYCDVTLEQDLGLEGVLELPGRQDSSSRSPRSDGG
jgi:hypothetical protein